MTTRDTLRHNTALKQEIASMGLRLEDVWTPTPHDPEAETRRLEDLVSWAHAYRESPNRRAMEVRGFQFPPVTPDIDPEADWDRFERWMRRDPVDWNFVERFGPVADPEGLTDADVDAELDRIRLALEQGGVLLELQEDLPPRLALCYLRRELSATRFDFAGTGGWWHMDGCAGCCPECVQRPWCEAGACTCWPEDEAAGLMVVPQEVEPYLTRTLPTAAELQDAEAAAG
jgi:hypothetical protein